MKKSDVQKINLATSASKHEHFSQVVIIIADPTI